MEIVFLFLLILSMGGNAVLAWKLFHARIESKVAELVKEHIG